MLPFYFGLAATAEPFVLAILGEKWRETAPLVPVLAMAMPLMTLQILFAPATNALGRPGLAVRTGIVGAAPHAARLPRRHPLGRRGPRLGLARRHGARCSPPPSSFRARCSASARRALAAAVAPGLIASAAMAAIVLALDAVLPDLGTGARLAALVAAGMAAYAGLLLAFARPIVEEVLALLRPQRAAAAA